MPEIGVQTDGDVCEAQHSLAGIRDLRLTVAGLTHVIQNGWHRSFEKPTGGIRVGLDKNFCENIYFKAFASSSRDTSFDDEQWSELMEKAPEHIALYFHGCDVFSDGLEIEHFVQDLVFHNFGVPIQVPFFRGWMERPMVQEMRVQLHMKLTDITVADVIDAIWEEYGEDGWIGENGWCRCSLGLKFLDARDIEWVDEYVANAKGLDVQSRKMAVYLRANDEATRVLGGDEEIWERLLIEPLQLVLMPAYGCGCGEEEEEDEDEDEEEDN